MRLWYDHTEVDQVKLIDVEADPELVDENDPEFQAEMFDLFRYLGWKPENLRDPEDARAYAEWLKTAPTNDR